MRNAAAPIRAALVSDRLVPEATFTFLFDRRTYDSDSAAEPSCRARRLPCRVLVTVGRGDPSR
ncbi:hypothetical protein GCM10010251_67160 [Streptomyces aurantiogriseus]|uniref:Uncharacterized protein n=1 Tax=Streptomyces aurantiogriseus TaxID=66870 RepID=A0A918KXS5_9ACTN|nr:hypothetical protein GCM10010251_67160 [Streptomyces aurantiogriseus]